MAIMQASAGAAPEYVPDPAPVEETPEADPSQGRRALVTKLLAQIASAKAHWAPQFKRMEEAIKFADGDHWPALQAGGVITPEERLQADIVQRHVGSRTSALYARNPSVVVKRKQRIDFTLWDESEEQLRGLYTRMQNAQMMGELPAPQDMALLQDIAEGMSRRKLIDKLAKTATLLITHSFDSQEPDLKSQVKDLVPGVITCGVGYIRTGYQRVLKKRVETEAGLYDVTSQLATLERLQRELAEGEIDTYSADIEQAQIIRAKLEAEPETLAREGVVYSFPCATTILPDKKCKSLIGFLGCDWVAEIHPLTQDDIEEFFGVDMKGKATSYAQQSDGTMKLDSDCEEPVFVVYEMMHKKDGVTYWLCEGYPDFLEEPRAPDAWAERFWNHRAVIFNRSANKKQPFPKSDVMLLIPLQKEINRTLESLRQHRIAATPKYASAKGVLDAEDKAKLTSSAPHSVVELAIPAGTDIEKVLQQVKKAAIDPNIYTLDPIYDAILRVSGSQEANLGGTSNSSATESSIAEASRMSSLSSNADDMDDLLSGVARDTGQLHMKETSRETVVRVVGKGAVWFDTPVQDIVDELDMSVRAGSSGRPNADRTLAKLERAAPVLLQLPGVKGERLAEILISALDEGWDLADFYDPSIPSITAQNAQVQPGTGNPSTDPNAQGSQGGNNKAKQIEGKPGSQPQYLLANSVDNNVA